MKKSFLLLTFILTLVLCFGAYLISGEQGYLSRNVMIPGIIILAIISILSFLVSERSLLHDNPNRFVRGVMASTFLKFFLCILSVGILLFSLKQKLHKPDLFALMGVYMIYSIVEAWILSQAARKKNASKS
ncbi:MAG: hypothetical protein JNJ58_03265 [Chitinophagaceae bacterium]|nr:hypothetical protein [Chitinophagaceae bacterium]